MHKVVAIDSYKVISVSGTVHPASSGAGRDGQLASNVILANGVVGVSDRMRSARAAVIACK